MVHVGHGDRHAGEVHQVIVLQVLADTVAAPGAAADGHGDGQAVVLAPGGLIDVEAAHGHQAGGVIDALLIVGPDGTAVAGTAVDLQIGDGGVHRVLKPGVGGVAQHGGHDLLAQDIGGVSDLALENDGLVVVGHGDAHHGGDHLDGAADDLAVDGAVVGEDQFTQLVDVLCAGDMVGTGGVHGFQKLLFPVGGDVDGLLAGAGNTVLEGAAHDHVSAGTGQVRIVLVHQGLAVALAHAEAGLAAGVHGLDHAGAAHADVGVAGGHHGVAGLDGTHLGGDAEHQILGGADGLQVLADVVSHVVGGVGGHGMGSRHEGVAGLDGHHSAADDRAGGIGAGQDAAHHTQGLGKDAHAGLVGADVGDLTHGDLAPQEVPVAGAGIEDLHLLLGHAAHVALGDGRLGDLVLMVQHGHADGADHLIDGTLVGVLPLELPLGGAAALDQICNVLVDGIDFRHINSPFLTHSGWDRLY